MFVVNQPLDGGWNLLRCELEAHLIDGFIKSFMSHLIFLDLVLVRIFKSLTNAVLDLILLNFSFIFNSRIALLPSGGELILERFVLLFLLFSKLAFDIFINLIQFFHEASSFIIVGGVVDLKLQTLSLINMRLELVENFTLCQFLNLLLDDLVLIASITGMLTSKSTVITLLLLTICFLITPLLFHLVHQKL